MYSVKIFRSVEVVVRFVTASRGAFNISPLQYYFLIIKQLRWSSGKSVCLWSCRLEFDSESSQTNDFKIGIHSFPA